MRHAVPSDPKTLGKEDFDLAMHCIDIVLKYRAYTLAGGLLVLLLCRFCDDVREAHGKEMLLPVDRGSQILPLGDLDLSELGVLTEALDTLLLKFAKFMDDPELPEELGRFRSALRVEQAERDKAGKGATANAKAS
jgi:hypothetical protein